MPSKSSSQHSRRSSHGSSRSSRSANDRPSGLGRPQWSGTLSFGLVSIPVELYSGTRSGGVALRLLAPDGVPLSRRFFCPEHEEPVDNDHLVRGYEHTRGEYVVVTDEELEGLAPDKSRDIDLRSFAPLAELDPVYFDRSFFLLPAGTSSKAYQLLASVMEDSERAGIATFVMRDREYLVAILAQDGLLTAQTLRFPDQVRSTDTLDLPSTQRVAASAVDAFTKVIRKHSRDELDLEHVHDEGADALRKLAEKKARSAKNVVHAKAAEDVATDAEIIDLMDVLQRSLKGHVQKQGATQLKATLKATAKPARRKTG